MPSVDPTAQTWRAQFSCELIEADLRIFILIQQALAAVEPALQTVTQEMLAIYAAEDVTEQDRELALHTLTEILQPHLAPRG